MRGYSGVKLSAACGASAGAVAPKAGAEVLRLRLVVFIFAAFWHIVL